MGQAKNAAKKTAVRAKIPIAKGLDTGATLESTAGGLRNTKCGLVSRKSHESGVRSHGVDTVSGWGIFVTTCACAGPDCEGVPE